MAQVEIRNDKNRNASSKEIIWENQSQTEENIIWKWHEEWPALNKLL